MAKQKVVVTGVAEIDRKLALLETKIQTKVARNALKKATKAYKAKAKQSLNSQWDKETGDLERTIKDGALKRSRSRIGRWFGTKTKDRNDLAGFSSSTAQNTYRKARLFVALGTKARDKLGRW